MLNSRRMQKILFIAIALFIISCSSAQRSADINTIFLETNTAYLNGENEQDEAFRILLSSDRYDVLQLKYKKRISRVSDSGGDRYMQDEVKKYNKINEAHEGVLTIWLYPDTGKIMKVRPRKLICLKETVSSYSTGENNEVQGELVCLKELNELITDDIRRWNFSFPGGSIEPTRLDIKYRVILQKKQSDEAIMKEMQKIMREKQ